MNSIIDRRPAGKNKSVGNRERFLRRYKGQIKEAVRRAVQGRGIEDMERGEEVRIPQRDVSEPVFHHGQGGVRETVHPGNKDHLRGDRIRRPEGGQGQGGGKGKASDSGEGEDDFIFSLSKEEFMKIFFEDLALPNLAQTQLAEVVQYKQQRAGYSSDGTPNNLHVVRSLRGAIGRRVALGASTRGELRRTEQELLELQAQSASPDEAACYARTTAIEALAERVAQLKAKLARIPYLDPIDLRFRHRVRVPVPSTRAVMFCVMDVSGSMDEARKDLSKRFFILLYLFLTRHYEKIDLVFIRHHTQAAEVSEQEFFHARETGGTVVSSALTLMHEIIQARYSPADWNIYCAQASDGDNWHHDSGHCRDLIVQRLLPVVRYFAYVQVAEEEQNLWQEYSHVAAAHKNFAMRKATEPSHIYPVLRELFRKEGVEAQA